MIVDAGVGTASDATWPLVLRLGDALRVAVTIRCSTPCSSPGTLTGCCTDCRGGGICRSSIPTRTCSRSLRTCSASPSQPQAGNESITIQLDQPTDVSHLRLTVGRLSYPRHLIIESTADGRTWETLHSGRGFERLLPGAVPVDRLSFMDFPLPPNTSRLIRLRQTGSTPMFYWSMHEIELWSREE